MLLCRRSVAMLTQAIMAHEFIAFQATYRGAHIAPAAIDARVIRLW